MTEKTEQVISKNTRMTLGMSIAALATMVGVLGGLVSFSGRWGRMESRVDTILDNQDKFIVRQGKFDERQRSMEHRLTRIEAQMDSEERVK